MHCRRLVLAQALSERKRVIEQRLRARNQIVSAKWWIVSTCELCEASNKSADNLSIRRADCGRHASRSPQQQLSSYPRADRSCMWRHEGGRVGCGAVVQVSAAALADRGDTSARRLRHAATASSAGELNRTAARARVKRTRPAEGPVWRLARAEAPTVPAQQ